MNEPFEIEECMFFVPVKNLCEGQLFELPDHPRDIFMKVAARHPDECGAVRVTGREQGQWWGQYVGFDGDFEMVIRGTRIRWLNTQDNAGNRDE